MRNVQDPEHPLTLEQLNVVREELIDVVDTGRLGAADDDGASRPDRPQQFSTVRVQFT